MTNFHETILYVNLKTLENNYNFLKGTLAKDCKIIAVVKAYAYGLGDIEIAKKLEEIGVYGFWVADFDEGIQLRKSGITRPIIVANPGTKSIDAIIKWQLEPVIYSRRLLDLYASQSFAVNIHLKFNSGMNRYGFDICDLDTIIDILKNNSHLNVSSFCSHLSSSNDEEKDRFSQQQMETFNSVRLKLNEALNKNIPSHILNSNGTLRMVVDDNRWVRLGISLYGGIDHPSLKQIFSLHSVISQIRTIRAGDYVGYQNTFVAKTNMKIAIIPIGYADGLDRKLGHSKGKMMVSGKACSLIGEISMDSCIIDITTVNAKEGEEVVVFSPDYPVSNLSNELGTISYEIMATLNRRIKRVYLNE
ncbi:MAG: alanine racemase [Flavobacteriales bacterium]